jgi:peptidoglycan/xylan/chitin deacetylase (PgdA/CDA1 family)
MSRPNVERNLRVLPLLLWRTPPALERILRQEGIAFKCVDQLDRDDARDGRFLLFDSAGKSGEVATSFLGPGQVGIDVNGLRLGHSVDPFLALVDLSAGHSAWVVEGRNLVERVSKYDQYAIRIDLISRLRQKILAAGGLWARISPYPYPYRSAFNFRADLDESYPEDLQRFAVARKPVDDCTTHFVSTAAYGHNRAVLDSLRGLDVQSHGHFHHVYPDLSSNSRNLARAHVLLCDAGFEPIGFAAPGGRWNQWLDAVLWSHRYCYSSDFSIGFDDLPYFPWLGDRFSNVLQLPIHPVCEGLFIEAGLDDQEVIASYFADVISERLSAGEPAFVYGHPERRLARMPRVLQSLHEAVKGHSLVWRVTLTEFARWWRWRDQLRWSVVPAAGDRFEVVFEEWSNRYPIALVIDGSDHTASMPLHGPRTMLPRSGISFERRIIRADRASPRPIPAARGIRPLMRKWLDWETVTPIDELPTVGLFPTAKRQLRRLKSARQTLTRGARS